MSTLSTHTKTVSIFRAYVTSHRLVNDSNFKLKEGYLSLMYDHKAHRRVLTLSTGYYYAFAGKNASAVHKTLHEALHFHFPNFDLTLLDLSLIEARKEVITSHISHDWSPLSLQASDFTQLKELIEDKLK